MLMGIFPLGTCVSPDPQPVTVLGAALQAMPWSRFPSSQDVKQRADFQKHSPSLIPAITALTGRALKGLRTH